MQSCPRCGRQNPIGAAYCAGCGQPLGYPPQPPGSPYGNAPAPSAAAPLPSAVAASPGAPTDAFADQPLASAARRPSRVVLGVLGSLALVGLAAATTFKAVSQPGRVIPPANPKLRALPPPTKSEPDEGAEPAPPPPQRPAAGQAPVKTPAGQKVANQPETKQPDLGPPPSQGEIQACINKRKARLRGCAEEAAQRMEFPAGGTARATLNPNGKFTNVRVPGSGYFPSCAARVIRGLTCCAYHGGPIEVSYPLR